ncbi:MAG: hypothetical protein U9Q73_01405, partial [Nanoarchaeota archaeon]|nr:hypothetical protein [Nanoarchaeota archaeon]
MEKRDTPYADAYRRRMAQKNAPTLARKETPRHSIKKKCIVEKVKEEVKGVKDFAHKEEKALEKKFGKKKVRKVEHYIVFSIYVLVFLVGGYFLITSAFPEIMPDDFYSYSISAGDSMITNNLRSLYLADSDALGGATEVDNVTARLITVEKPFIFVFNPKRKVAENTSAQIQLQFVNPSTEIYLNENLIVPDLDDYKKVADFSDENKEVWVKKDISGATPTENQTAEEFIYANYPGKNIYSFGEMESGTPIISDYKPTNTFISTRFRDNLKLAVYAEGDLKIDFIKQDLNMYLGKDEYTVEITDLKGNSYFKEIYGDDGDKKDSSVGEFEQEVHLIGRNLPRSIYYITFTKDEKNKGADSTIKNIRVNSNKVLIVGDILPWSDFKFYTKVSSEKIIGFN